MTDDGETTRKDLAFLKALVSEGPKVQGTGGVIFMTAGLAYGLDCIAYWAQMAFQIPLSLFMWRMLGLLPTLILFAVIAWVMWRNGKQGEQGVATRALNAAYISGGMINLVIALIFGYVATLEKSMLIWLLYPVVMCAFQGAIWYIAYMVRRKLWLAGVSAGWFATTLGLGLLVRDTQTYLLVLGIALIVLMGGAGWTLIALNRRQLAGETRP